VTIKPGRFNYDIAKSHLQSADCRKVFWVGKKKNRSACGGICCVGNKW